MRIIAQADRAKVLAIPKPSCNRDVAVLDPGYWLPPHSGWMPASLIILPHLPSCSLTRSASSSGELENASKPALPRVDLTSALSMILRSSVLSSVMISAGVPAGAKMPAHESMSNPVTPASSSVGNSGTSVERLILVTASARSEPAFTCGNPVVRSANIIDTRPARTSLSATGTVLYGTCSMSISAQCLSVSPATMPEVLPLANDSLPGFALPYSINSFTDLAAMLGCTHSMRVKLPMRVIAAKSLTASYPTFFIRNGAAECGLLVLMNNV